MSLAAGTGRGTEGPSPWFLLSASNHHDDEKKNSRVYRGWGVWRCKPDATSAFVDSYLF